MVPNGWDKTRLKHIARIKSGSTPLRAKQDVYYSIDGTPWVKTLDLNNSEIIKTDERITELALKETSCSIFPVNTVLVAMYGGFNQIGRTGLLTVPSAINQALSGLILDSKKAEPKYILNYLNGNVRQWKKFAASSRKDPNITREDVCGFEVLLPPLPEQQKIAKILSTWDKAIATTERLIATSQQQKKALMQQLLTGKKRFVNPETGMVFEGDWEHGFLGNLCVFKGGSAFKEMYQGQTDGDYPFIKVSDMNLPKNGKFILQANNWLSADVAKEIKAKAFEKGAVVFAKVGAALLLNRRRILVQPTIIDNNMMAATPNKKCHTEFLYQLMLMIDFAKLVQDGAVPSINQSDLSRFKITYPVLEEQQKIASVLTAADKEIELLEAKLAQLKEEKKALMQQLLTGKRRVKIEHMEEVTC